MSEVKHSIGMAVTKALWCVSCSCRMDILQRHMPVAGQDGVNELLMIVWRFEEKIFQAATDQVYGTLSSL